LNHPSLLKTDSRLSGAEKPDPAGCSDNPRPDRHRPPHAGHSHAARVTQGGCDRRPCCWWTWL